MTNPTEILPTEMNALLDDLVGMPGVLAVMMGGSRVMGTADEASDWDLSVYYRVSSLDLAALRKRGEVHEPGMWGPIMNGGAWLDVVCAADGVSRRRVDVLLRDVDVVAGWCERAERGDFEVHALLGYAAGVPTYMLRAEVVTGRVLRGELPASLSKWRASTNSEALPDALVKTAVYRWRFARTFTLMHAKSRAKRNDIIGAVAQASKAVLEEAHARACERGIWIFNEKRLIEIAGLAALHERFTRVPQDRHELLSWLDDIESHLTAASR